MTDRRWVLFSLVRLSAVVFVAYAGPALVFAWLVSR